VRWPLSLTSRLTTFFTLLAIAIVLGVWWLFTVAVEQHFLDLDRTTLQDKQHLISGILASASSMEDARGRLREALSSHHGLYVVVRTLPGEALFKSDGFQPPEALFAAGAPNEGRVLQHWMDEGREFRGVRRQASPAYRAASQLEVLVAVDTKHHTQFMAELQRTLAAYAVLTTIVSGLLGWFAAHQGLAPLRAMKTRAAVVTGQQLGQRMPVEAVPIEMADLALELNQMLDRLQDAFRRLSDFASDLAHELRTPISNLLTQTEVTLSANRDGETYRDILASNAEELQRLARTVSDMLFLAKTERGVDLPNVERFSAAKETQALLEFYDAVAEEKGVKLNLRGDGNILGDRLMFRRAVSNLLSNALCYTWEGGEVTVEISETPQATLVAVENTGDDIDPQALPRLFDRFFRVAAARAHPESDGAGLGLSITRAIVQAHGGIASVSSSQGRTRFVLEFPRRASPGSLRG
jgi:two-component system heavy metal sensor histidine kinase CusS